MTRALPRSELLERDRELEQLHDTLERARGGRGGVVLVEAPAGLGKSRLLAAAAELAGGLAMQSLSARAAELERDFPFGVTLQLFETRLREAPAAERQRLLAGAAGLAAALFGDEPPPLSGRTGPSEFPLLHGLHWLTANLADERPLLLRVDDAHWADDLSLRFLLYLAQRVEELPVAAVVAVRPGEPGAPAELLSQLAAHPATRTLRPAPLSAEAVRRLVAAWSQGDAEPHPDFASACFEVTRGNPLLLRELLTALHEEGVGATAQGAARVREVGPEPVTRAIYLALRRLSPDATALARSVSVLGDGAEPAHAARLADIPESRAAAAAGALAAAGVLAPGRTLAFVHPIVRTAVYRELQPSERAMAHRQAAKLLHEASAAPERVAGHALQSVPSGDADLIEPLRRAAGQAAARGAPEAAAEYLRRAVAERPSDARAELLAELARAETAAGLPTALERFEQALSAGPDARSRAELLRGLGHLLFGQGRFQEAADAFERGIAAIDGAGEPLALELQAGYANAALWDPARGVAAYERLEPLLERGAEPTTLAERVVLGNLAGAEMFKGEDRERAVELALRAWGDGALLEQGTCDESTLPAITGVLTASDELAASKAVSDAIVADARRRGSIFAFATASYLRGAALLRWCSVQEAIADAEQAIDARRYGWDVFLPAAYWVLGEGLLEQGRLDDAARAVGFPAEDEERWAESPLFAGVHIVRGRLALERGDPGSALREFRRMGTLLEERLGTRNPAFFSWRTGAAVAAARVGDREEARRLADEELELARRYGARQPIGNALRARALVEGGAGAVEPLREAVAVLEESPAELDRARSLVDLGAALRASGQRAAAREPLPRGLDLADRCGALRLAGRAREELVAAGGRPRRRRLSGPDSLTPSERRVAGMAAAGMRNREIAEALFVTVKAVQFHLGNAYAKLGVRGREELAAALPPSP